MSYCPFSNNESSSTCTYDCALWDDGCTFVRINNSILMLEEVMNKIGGLKND